MSKVNYTWSSEVPPKPDVYTTRRNESKYLTLRYWDGECWFEIAWTASRGGVPFAWPAKSRTKRPAWAVKYKDSVSLRRISASLANIQWGTAFKGYDSKEVLKWLVQEGILRADWMTHYQGDMPQGAKP